MTREELKQAVVEAAAGGAILLAAVAAVAHLVVWVAGMLGR